MRLDTYFPTTPAESAENVAQRVCPASCSEATPGQIPGTCRCEQEVADRNSVSSVEQSIGDRVVGVKEQPECVEQRVEKHDDGN